MVFPQVGVAEGVEYTSRSFTYHHAALAEVDCFFVTMLTITMVVVVVVLNMMCRWLKLL